MTRSMFPLLVAALVAVPAAPAPKAKEPPPSAPASYWPTVVGATREYQYPGGTEKEIVTAVTRKDDVMTVAIAVVGADGTQTPRNKVEIRKDGVYLMEEVGQKYDSPVCLLKLPLTTGTRWEEKTQRPDLGPVLFKTEVGETATIETPAGKFEAVKVTRVIVRGGGQPDITGIQWYAKEHGAVKIDAPPKGVLKVYTAGKE